jgi:hypothetical protein
MATTLSQQTANRFREVILNGTWIANTNFKHQLEHLDYKVATTQVDALNTIAILAEHIHYYIAGVKNVFNGGKLEIKDSYSFDFEPIESQEQWDTFLALFWNDAEEFASYIENLSDEELHHYFVAEKYGTYLRNIDGMIEHSYYHLGQIALLKKMISAQQ